jgi:hypothetical protein
MAESKTESKGSDKKDDAFKPEGRPTALEVAEKTARDERVEEAPDFGGEKR